MKSTIEPENYISKVESLFERYFKQWDDGKPQGPHNIPRRGQLRETTGKRTFKQLVENQKKSECSGPGDSEKESEDHIRQFEITSQNLEDNASII